MPDALPPVSPMRTAPPPARRRRFSPRLIGLLCIPLLAAAGGGWWWLHRGEVTTDDAYVAGDIAPISSRIEGDIDAILVADNATVTAGQPLIRLVDADWRARRDLAAAAVTEARAAHAALLAQEAQAQANLDAATAAVPQAEAGRELAIAEAARFGSLAASGVGSRERAEQTRAAMHQADATLTAAHAGQAAAAAALPVLAAQTESAVARIAQAEANLALAENNLGYTIIRAPFDGTVSNRAAQLGLHVKPGQGLISLTPPASRQWVVANFKETQLATLRAGQPADVVLDVTGETLRGHVDSFAGATGALFSLLPPENATGNFTRIIQRLPVRIALDDSHAMLRPGLSATVTVDTNPKPQP